MLLTVAMVCSIPLYINGILQRMLIKDLENYQRNSGQYPGKYEVKLELYQNYSSKEGQQYKTYNYFNNRIQGSFFDEIGAETISRKRELHMNYLYVTPEELYGKTEDARSTGEMFAVEGLWDNIEIVGGRLPSLEPVDGVIECVIFSQLQKSDDIILDKIYVLENYSKRESEPIKIRPVGIIEPKSGTDKWWAGIYEYYDAFLMDYDYMQSYFLYENEDITRAKWVYQFDYTKISIEDLNSFTDAINSQDEWFAQYSGAKMTFRALSIFEEYFERAGQLRLTLWVLQGAHTHNAGFLSFHGRPAGGGKRRK